MLCLGIEEEASDVGGCGAQLVFVGSNGLL